MPTPPIEPRIEHSDTRAERAAARRRSRRRHLQSAALLLGAVVVLASAAAALWMRPGHTLGARVAGNDGANRSTATTRTASASSESTAPTAPPPTAAEVARPATLTVSAVGDMIFDRRVKALISRAGGLAPLAKVADRLARADVALGNLESNLSSSGSRDPDKDVTFRGHPKGIVGLSAAGFDFLALGNNHVLDYGPQSLADTLAALDGAGILHAGAGTNRAEAWAPAVVTREGATVAFLSFSHILPPGFVATDSKAGLAAGRGNMNAVAAAIRAAKAANDYVIVSFHWGVEYKDYANGDQVRDARRAIDAGADMVLSHHPHVIQGIEFYRRGLIAYSLGDFVFDHYSRRTGEAFILDADLGPNGVANVTATPVYLDVDGAPAVVTGAAATAILSRLREVSRQHGTRVAIGDNIARALP